LVSAPPQQVTGREVAGKQMHVQTAWRQRAFSCPRARLLGDAGTRATLNANGSVFGRRARVCAII
jgi:hypothetical protein